MEKAKRQIIYIDNFSISLVEELLISKDSIYGYVYGLKDCIEDIIKELIRLGYKDKTDKDGKTLKGEFTYLICKEKKVMKVFIKVNSRVSITLVDFCNIVAGNRIQLKETYGKDSVQECMQEAIEQLQAFGMTESSTIGGATLKIFRDSINYNYSFKFPHSIYDIKLPKSFPYIKNVGDMIRASYSGGWCYLNPEYSEKEIESGIVLDDNSLYPFCMCNFDYPVGKPTLIWEGEYPKEYETFRKNRYLFYCIRTRFSVKPDKFPFIKIKNDFRYKQNETPLKVDNNVVLVLNETDMELFKECYNIDYLEYIGGCAFQRESGEYLFGDYIRKLYDIKQTSTGVVKHTAKMLLNNLGGKFGSGTDSTHYVYNDKEETLKVKYEWNRRGSYIPVASAMTAYARKITMTAAMQNKDRFIYSDTDSCHLVGTDIPKLPISTNMGDWKIEDKFTCGYYSGQKVYSFKSETPHKYYRGEEIIESPIKFVVAGMIDSDKIKYIEMSDYPAKVLKEAK